MKGKRWLKMQSTVHLAEKKRTNATQEALYHENHQQEFLSMRIAGQLFGIPVLQVQDVLSQQKVTHIPLAPKEIAGSLNLRGRIVTAIDVRVRLGATVDETKKSMNVVIEHGEELYSLVVDEVGDVLKLTQDCYEKSLATLDELWKEISGGIYRLDKELLVLLDIPRLLKSVYPKIDEINEVE